MKFRVDEITQDGITIQESIDASSWDLDSSDLKFIGFIQIVAKAFLIADTIEVEVELDTTRDILCNRCLMSVKKKDNQKFKLFYDKKDLADYLDIDEDIREQILLNYPMKVLCKDDCLGICPDCGINLNTGNCQCQKNKES